MKYVSIDRLPAYLKVAMNGPFKGTVDFFNLLGALIDQDVQLTFQSVKAAGIQSQQVYNRTTWKGYSLSTLHPKRQGAYDLTVWRPRRGTDGSGKNGDIKYSQSSKLLQRSGLFRKSFGTISVSNKRLIYGSRHPLAEHLQKDRPVLEVDEIAETRYANLFVNWLGRNLDHYINVTPGR